VIETCQNCKSHGWNTRHDENKYLDYFNRVSQAIVERIPNAVTMRNQIPKEYLPFDLYCNLIPNSDANSSAFMQVPRTGSFEVSFKGLLIFSKLQGAYWPNVELVASKCEQIIGADQNGEDVSPYLAAGSTGKVRGGSPSKRGTAKKLPSEKVTPAKNFSAENSQQ
jgi:selT/selW/selH-like putative selenoprotein